MKKQIKKGKDCKKAVGRPSIVTDLVVEKLEQAFSFGCNVSQACIYADITRDNFYKFIARNKEFSDRFRMLQQNPVLKARMTVFNNLTDPKIAVWYLNKFREPLENMDKKEKMDNLSLEELSKMFMKKLMSEAIKNPDDKAIAGNMLKLLGFGKE